MSDPSGSAPSPPPKFRKKAPSTTFLGEPSTPPPYNVGSDKLKHGRRIIYAVFVVLSLVEVVGQSCSSFFGV